MPDDHRLYRHMAARALFRHDRLADKPEPITTGRCGPCLQSLSQSRRWLSVSNDYFNFSPTETDGTVADNSAICSGVQCQ
jgi:hypothetical protein